MRTAGRAKIENGLAVANAALVVVVVAAQRFPGERWWPTLVLAYSPQQVWAILPVLLGGYFFFRRQWLKALSAAALTVLVLTALVGAPLSLPRAPTGAPANLRIVTWNLHYGEGGPVVAELARKLWPDVICLQEANPWADQGVPELLSLPAFKGWNHNICGELVVLSRYPLKRLGTTHSALWVSADLGEQELVIANVHLAQPYVPSVSNMTNSGRLHKAAELRKQQISEILDFLPVDRAAVVCGDFNTPPNTRTYRMLTSVLTDSFRSVGSGMGLSYSRRIPLVRIDHVFTSTGARPVRCFLPAINASNHRPVCTDVLIGGWMLEAGG